MGWRLPAQSRLVSEFRALVISSLRAKRSVATALTMRSLPIPLARLQRHDGVRGARVGDVVRAVRVHKREMPLGVAGKRVHRRLFPIAEKLFGCATTTRNDPGAKECWINGLSGLNSSATR